jgi:hypothetical protein
MLWDVLGVRPGLLHGALVREANRAVQVVDSAAAPRKVAVNVAFILLCTVGLALVTDEPKAPRPLLTTSGTSMSLSSARSVRMIASRFTPSAGAAGRRGSGRRIARESLATLLRSCSVASNIFGAMTARACCGGDTAGDCGIALCRGRPQLRSHCSPALRSSFGGNPRYGVHVSHAYPAPSGMSSDPGASSRSPSAYLSTHDLHIADGAR